MYLSTCFISLFICRYFSPVDDDDGVFIIIFVVVIIIIDTAVGNDACIYDACKYDIMERIH